MEEIVSFFRKGSSTKHKLMFTQRSRAQVSATALKITELRRKGYK
jgi:hypothetical protein